MVRLMLVVAVIAGAAVFLKGRLDDANDGALATPQASSAQVPPQFRTILANQQDPMTLLRQRGALPGLEAITRLASSGATGKAPTQPAPFADVGSREEVRDVQADVRRDIRALNRLSDKNGSSIVEVEHVLSEVYSAPVLAALGEQGRRAFAARVAGRTQAAQRIRVLDFQGVFVSGHRALAQVVYRLATRAPSGRFVARVPSIWTVTLALEDGRWRFVRGIEG